MPLPNNYDIDRVFRLAGFPYGRPIAERPTDYAESGANNWATLVSLFDDDQIDFIVDNIVSRSVDIPLIAGDNPVFEHLLAAELLQSVTTAGYTQIGRPFDVNRVNFGDISQDFDEGATVRDRQSKSIAELRLRAHYIAGQIPSETVMSAFRDSGINPAHIERRDITLPNTTKILSGETLTSKTFELNAGAYLTNVSFSVNLSSGTSQLGFGIRDNTTGEVLYTQRVYWSETNLDIKLPLITLLLTDDADMELTFQVYGRGNEVVVSNIELQLFPLWSDIDVEVDDIVERYLMDNPIPAPDIADNSITIAKLAATVLARIAPTLTGNGGKFLAVNGAATAVELVDAPSPSGGGLPTTRTAVFTGNSTQNAQTSATFLNENLEANTLYEVVGQAGAYALILTPSSGTIFPVIFSRNNVANQLVATVGSRSGRFNQIGSTANVDGSFTINKLS